MGSKDAWGLSRVLAGTPVVGYLDYTLLEPAWCVFGGSTENPET